MVLQTMSLTHAHLYGALIGYNVIDMDLVGGILRTSTGLINICRLKEIKENEHTELKL